MGDEKKDVPTSRQEAEHLDQAPLLFQDLGRRDYTLLKAEIRSIVQDVVREEMQRNPHKCKLDVTEDEAREIAGFTRKLRSLGNGHVGQGFEIIYENHRWMKTQREIGSKLSFSILLIILAGVSSGIIAALWMGFKEMIKRG